MDSSFGLLINRASRAIRRNWNAELSRRGYPITGEHFAVLVHIRDNEDLGPAAIAGILDKDRPAVTRLLAELERLGWVNRYVRKQDTRCISFRLTKKGTHLITPLTRLAAKVLARAQDGIDAGKLKTCREVLRQVHENLSARRKEIEP